MLHYFDADRLAARAFALVRNACGDAAAAVYVLRRGGVPVSVIAAMRNELEEDVEAALAAADRALVETLGTDTTTIVA